MNEALRRWRDEFDQDPHEAFDRLVRGLVPLGVASQLSFAEILESVFDIGEQALDSAAAGWLSRHILSPIPEDTTAEQWGSVLQSFFRGIVLMELPVSGGLLRDEHGRLRIWLHGFYDGPAFDPEGAYLLALTRAQIDRRFSTLWRALILDEDLERSYRSIGILGFQKMPAHDGRPSADVPDGLLNALLEMAEVSRVGQTDWTRIIRSVFANYPRSRRYWTSRLGQLLASRHFDSNARVWLAAILPGVTAWRSGSNGERLDGSSSFPPAVAVSREWARRLRRDPSQVESAAFATFLGSHREYAEATGDTEFINKTFNNLAISLVRGNTGRLDIATSLIQEALRWEPSNPHNWTSYAIILDTAQRADEALDALWEARQRFPWNTVVRSELGRLLRENGDLIAAEGVLREASSHFPQNVVVRNGLAETLRAMGRLPEALEVYKSCVNDFPQDVFARNGLADLLRELDDLPGAEFHFRRSLDMDGRDPFAIGGLSRVFAIRSARTNNAALREEARSMLRALADEGNGDAITRLRRFDAQWDRARIDPTYLFGATDDDDRVGGATLRQAIGELSTVEMSAAERLGRAMIDLWVAERADDSSQRESRCISALELLDIDEGRLDPILLPALVETRGLVMLASGDAEGALLYFDDQSVRHGRAGWSGVRLGIRRARIQLGFSPDDGETVDVLESRSTAFALRVATVIEQLRTADEATVGSILKTLFPVAEHFVAQAAQHEDVETDRRGGMLGGFLIARWFRPEGVFVLQDLDRVDVVQAVRRRAVESRTDALGVIGNVVLAG